MKTLTSTVIAANAAQAAEPLVIVAFNSSYYCEKAMNITIDSTDYSVKGLVKTIGAITSQNRASGVCTYSSVSVELFDDGTLKSLVDTGSLIKTSATLYLYHYGASEWTEIFKGYILSPRWSEGSRTLNLTVETDTFGKPVGYAPEEDEFTGFNNEKAGDVWPLCFGTVLKVPAVKVMMQGVEARIQQRWASSADLITADNPAGLTVLVGSPKDSSGDFIFPTETSISVTIGGIDCEGEFDENFIFTPSVINSAKDLNVLLATRPVNDNDYGNLSALWLDDEDDTISLTGKYCIINHGTEGWLVNYCISQVGKKCFFRQPWKVAIDGGTIEETAPVVRSSWAATYTRTAQDLAYRQTSQPLNGRWQFVEHYTGNQAVPDAFTVNVGAIFEYNNDNELETWVCNLIPSVEILEVYAYRTYGNENIFVPIPSSRYTTRLNYLVGSKYCTAITFEVPLSNWEAEQWSDQIYVSLRSSVGPNSTAIIRYLIETYTDLSIDISSYNEVSPLVADFWACFAVMDQPDAISLCEDIAFQSRIGLIIANDVVKMKFLANAPTPSSTIDEDSVLSESLELGFSEFDGLANKIKSMWLEDYTSREDVQHERVYEIESDYDTVEEELPCTIYNVEFFVKTFQEFWGYRKSKIWKQLAYTTFIDDIALENFDGVTHDLAVISSSEIDGIVTTTAHDPVNDVVSLSIELACQQGSQTQDDDYWPGNPTLPGNLDPGAGRYQIDYIPPVHQDTDEPDDDDGGGGGSQNEYQILIEESPTEVVRGDNFTFEAKVVRISDGVLSTTQRNAFLEFTLVGADDGEALNVTNGSFVNGRFTSDVMQITGGSGLKNGYIKISAFRCNPATCPSFRIKDAQSSGMTIEIDTATVRRGVPFTATIEGGGAGMVAEIELQSTDANDYALFSASGLLIDSVTLDGSGEYTGSWQIEGGSDNDIAVFGASDADGVYVSAYTDPFVIEGRSGNISISQRVRLEQTVVVDDIIVDVTGSAAGEGGTYSIDVDLTKIDGTPIDYDGTAFLAIYDLDGVPVEIGYAGPVSWLSNEGAYITLYGGAWSFEAVEIDWTYYISGDLTCVVTVNYEGNEIVGSDDLIVGLPTFVVSASVATVQRGTAFTLTIDTLDRFDDIVDFTPTQNLVVTFTPTDGSDVLSIIEIDTSGWSDGHKEVTGVTIEGGTGSGDYADIQVDYLPTGITGNTDVGVQDGAPVIPTMYRVIFPSSLSILCNKEYSDYCVNNGSSNYIGKTHDLPVATASLAVTTSCWVSLATYKLIGLSYSGGYWEALAYFVRQMGGTSLKFNMVGHIFRSYGGSVCPTRLPYYYDRNMADQCTTGSGNSSSGYAIVTPII